MRDEYEDRLYQAFRHDLAPRVDTIVRSAAHAFDRLHARLFAAPWSGKTEECDKRYTVL